MQISLSTEFKLKLAILIFWNQFALKVYLQSDFNLLKKQISAQTDNFEFFDQISPNKVFLVKNGKIAFLRASMVVCYYIKLFRKGADRHNVVLMSLLLLVVDAINIVFLILIKSW